MAAINRTDGEAEYFYYKNKYIPFREGETDEPTQYSPIDQRH